jgi:hypothetical protein
MGHQSHELEWRMPAGRRRSARSESLQWRTGRPSQSLPAHGPSVPPAEQRTVRQSPEWHMGRQSPEWHTGRQSPEWHTGRQSPKWHTGGGSSSARAVRPPLAHGPSVSTSTRAVSFPGGARAVSPGLAHVPSVLATVTLASLGSCSSESSIRAPVVGVRSRTACYGS